MGADGRWLRERGWGRNSCGGTCCKLAHSPTSPSRMTACRLLSRMFWRSRSRSSCDLCHSSRSLTTAAYLAGIPDTEWNVSVGASLSCAVRRGEADVRAGFQGTAFDLSRSSCSLLMEKRRRRSGTYPSAPC